MRYPIHSGFLFAAAETSKGGGGDGIDAAIAELGEIPRIAPKKASDQVKDRQDAREIEDDKKKVDDGHGARHRR